MDDLTLPLAHALQLTLRFDHVAGHDDTAEALKDGAPPSPLTPSVFSFMRSPTISITSCTRSRYPESRNHGRHLASARNSSRPAKVVSHGGYATFQMAEVAVPRKLFGEILRLIDGLRQRPAPAQAPGRSDAMSPRKSVSE